MEENEIPKHSLQSQSGASPVKAAMRGAALLMLGAAAGWGQTPVADHHQHLFSPGLLQWACPAASRLKTITATDLITYLDSADIRRAVVLALADQHVNPTRKVEHEY